jgi:hypothetical protein
MNTSGADGTAGTGEQGELERLYAVQERDLSIAAFQHRRAVLPERAELDRTLRAGKAAHDALVALRARHDELARQIKALDDDTQSIAARAKAVDEKLYSGTVTSPRELQDLQADLDQLRRHQDVLEVRELEQMELAEQMDADLRAAETDVGARKAEVERLQRAIDEQERAIDSQISTDQLERARLAGAVDAALLADYERRRARNNGVGAALLLGDTCQGCRLSIPATEVDEIRRTPGAQRWYCDNCGAILVPR